MHTARGCSRDCHTISSFESPHTKQRHGRRGAWPRAEATWPFEHGGGPEAGRAAARLLPLEHSLSRRPADEPHADAGELPAYVLPTVLQEPLNPQMVGRRWTAGTVGPERSGWGTAECQQGAKGGHQTGAPKAGPRGPPHRASAYAEVRSRAVPARGEACRTGGQERPLLHRSRHVLREDPEGADRHAEQPVVGHKWVRLLLCNLIHSRDVHDHVDELVHVLLPQPVVASPLVVPLARLRMDLDLAQPR
eukprot:scaffold22404_cov112-Isochrysis_galbana.AAC.5